MEYQTIYPALFLSRPNRFIAHCQLGERVVVAHVKNTGRCRELLIAGARVYLEYAPSPTRKTAYSLICVEKGKRLINLDSQAPNTIFREGLERGIIPLPFLPCPITSIRPEVPVGGSRLDFLVQAGEQCCYVEVKGVTLEEDGVVLFPDAPTQRGVKHLEELCALARQGIPACLALIVQLEGVAYFAPNWKTDPAFGEALRRAKESGVHLLCYDCTVTPRTIVAKGPVPIRL